MLDIVCTRKEKTRVFLFFETYKMVFLLLQSETSCYHMLLSNVFMFRQSCTQDRCVSRLFLWLDALFLLSTTEIFIVVLPFFFISSFLPPPILIAILIDPHCIQSELLNCFWNTPYANYATLLWLMSAIHSFIIHIFYSKFSSFFYFYLFFLIIIYI